MSRFKYTIPEIIKDWVRCRRLVLALPLRCFRDALEKVDDAEDEEGDGAADRDWELLLA